MAVNPMNNKNLSRTHSKELAKNNRGKRTRKNSDYKTTATAARQAQSQAPQKAAWPTKVKVTLGILFGILVAALILRLAVPSLQDNPLLNNLTTLLLGISCGALFFFVRRLLPAYPPAACRVGIFAKRVQRFFPLARQRFLSYARNVFIIVNHARMLFAGISFLYGPYHFFPVGVVKLHKPVNKVYRMPLYKPVSIMILGRFFHTRLRQHKKTAPVVNHIHTAIFVFLTFCESFGALVGFKKPFHNLARYIQLAIFKAWLFRRSGI